MANLTRALDNLKQKEIVGLILRFVITGGISALMEMLILIFLVEHAHLNLLVANGISFIVTNIFNYILSRYWVFGKSEKALNVEATLFLLVAGVGLIINQIVMWGLVDVLHYNYKISKIMAILVVVVWNFLGKRFFVFSSITPKKNA